MKILHISDFHYNNHYTAAQEKMLDKMVEVLKNENIDLIFFTGDLVDKGGRDGKDFDLAYKKLNQKLKADNNSVFICCGNHDVQRDNEMFVISNYLQTVSDSSTLDQFTTKDPEQFKLSLANIKSYIDYQQLIYENKSDIIKDLYTIHKRVINEKNIGIVTINSAWRSKDSKTDNGALMYPMCLLEEVIQGVSDCEIKILLIHHPLSHFKDFQYYDIESIIYNNFNFLFSGHTHLDKIETHITGDEGIFSCVSPSTLTFGYTENKTGFTIIEFDEQNIYELKVCRYIYDKRSESFAKLNNIIINVPLEEKKQEILKYSPIFGQCL